MGKIVVVGGGAAGLMAAGWAAYYGADVIVYEKMPRVGRKLMITGKGRCNLANNCDVPTFLQNVPRNPKFLYSALNAFPPEDIISFFEEHGLRTKTERGNRVFPVSDKASDVVDTMRSFATDNGARILNEKVDSVITENDMVKAVVVSGKRIECDVVIIATGGKSYPRTGSTGDGYRFAREAGHTVTKKKPSLVPLESPDADCAEMQGLSLKNISFKIIDKNGKTIYNDFGELLFTHFGLSGPVVLSASCNLNNYADGYKAHIDLKPALSEEQLDLRIQRDFAENINKSVSNSLSGLLPRKMIPVILDRWGIDVDKKCNSVTKEERKKLLAILKNFTVEISSPRPIDEAIITSGGVSVDEINPKTMESKLVKGLYFAGEVIDVDAYTGGFNLVIAWSTGKTAGENAAFNS